MARKKSRNQEASQRVQHLCEALWQGSPTKMARDVGVTRSAIANVTTGRQEPGRAILAAIAADPRVNAKWLLTGQGEPLRKDDVDGFRMLPVVAVLQKDLPAEDAVAIVGRLPSLVAGSDPACYWYRAPQDHTWLGVAAGDLVLIDLDIDGYTRDQLAKVPGVVIELPTGELALGKPADFQNDSYLSERQRAGIRIRRPSGQKSEESRSTRDSGVGSNNSGDLDYIVGICRLVAHGTV